MHEKHMMTSRLVKYIEKNTLERTFSSLGKELGISEGTIRLLFRGYAYRELGNLDIVTPRWMGLDEIHFLSKFRGVVTNVEQRTLVDLLPSRNKRDVIRYLSQIKDKETIKLVTIDMWNPYREAVQLVLPHAEIVVDKFHIARMANEALERIRKRHRLSMTPRQRLRLKNDRWLLLQNPDRLSADRLMMLDAWIANYPILKAGYLAKEQYRAIWQCDSVEDAMHAYAAWKADLSPDVAPAFQDLITSMTNWEKEIFGFFKHRVTNAYTECVNGMGKILNRLGRGYSFEVIRAKMMLNYTHKKEAKRFVRTPSRQVFSMHEAPSFEEPQRSYGIDISTLRRDLLRTPLKP